MIQHPGHARRFAAAAGVLAVLAGGAGCGEDQVDLPTPVSPRPEPVSAPTSTLGPEEAEAWTEIQTRFDAFMETWIRWAAEGSPGGIENPAAVELGEHTDEFLLNEAATDLAELAQQEQLRTGRPQWRDARPVRFDFERTVQDQVVPEAVFEVCVDGTDWVVVAADSGEPAGTEPDGPQLWTITAWWAEQRDFGPDGWALTKREVDRRRPC